MLIMGLIFSFVTPVGIMIGILLGSSYNANSKTSLGMEAFFNAISSGILIYNGIVDLIIPTFDKHADDGPKTKWLTYTGFVCMLIGSGLMSLIAKWA
jgi:solute carrier family 39 (zinc transporter), member 1/2/3